MHTFNMTRNKILCINIIPSAHCALPTDEFTHTLFTLKQTHRIPVQDATQLFMFTLQVRFKDNVGKTTWTVDRVHRRGLTLDNQHLPNPLNI